MLQGTRLLQQRLAARYRHLHATVKWQQEQLGGQDARGQHLQ